MGGKRVLEVNDVAVKIMIAQMIMVMVMDVLMMMRLMISEVELWRDGNALYNSQSGNPPFVLLCLSPQPHNLRPNS